jgi:hypothetical protein
MFRSGRTLQKQSNPFFKTLGSMGTFMLIGLVLEGVSIDSFAMPYLWITTGIVTAATVLFIKENRNNMKAEEAH